MSDKSETGIAGIGGSPESAPSAWAKYAASEDALLPSEFKEANESVEKQQSQQTTNTGSGKQKQGWIDPPFNPKKLAKLTDRSETHAVACEKKSRYVAGFGFDLVPHEFAAAGGGAGGGTGKQSGGNDTPPGEKIVRQFWWGGTEWRLGPSARRATPDAVLRSGWYDIESVGYLTIEALLQRDNTLAGLAHVPAHTVRKRKDEPGYVQLDDKGQPDTYYGEAGGRFKTGSDDKQVFVDSETGKTATTINDVKNPANELLFWSDYSPLSLWYGSPPISSALETLEGNLAARKYNTTFFQNDAVPRFVVSVEGGKLTDKAWQKLRKQLRNLKPNSESHRGILLEAVSAAEDQASAEGVSVNIEPLTVGVSEDASFLEYQRENEQDILKAHEVPPVVAGRVENANYNTAQEQRRIFAEEVIQPKQEDLAALLYQTVHKIYLDDGAENWTFDFHLKGADVPKREAEVAKLRSKAARGTLKVNEYREELGEEPLDGEVGEMLLVEINPKAAADGGGTDESGGSETQEQTRSDVRIEQLMEKGASAD